MPILSVFFGIVVRMYHADHPPPHFHVQYGDQSAVIEIRTGEISQGNLSSRVRKMVEEWRKDHLKELEKAWDDAQNLMNLKKITPLK